MSIAAEALLAITGPFQKTAITKGQGREAEALARLWRTKVREWLALEKPARFRMYSVPDHERTLDVLVRGIDAEEAETLLSKITNPDIITEYQFALSNAREYLRSIWPALALDTPTGPILLEPSRTTMGKLASVYGVVENPTRLLDEMCAGTITADQVTAVRAVFPAVFEMLLAIIDQEKIRLQAKRKSYRMPWMQERVYRILLGMPVGVSLTTVEQPPPKMSAPNIEIDFEREATRSQRIEAK